MRTALGNVFPHDPWVSMSMRTRAALIQSVCLCVVHCCGCTSTQPHLTLLPPLTPSPDLDTPASRHAHPQVSIPSLNAAMVLWRVRPGSVIVLHDARLWLLPTLAAVLPELSRRGYKVVTLSELVAGDARQPLLNS
jgi:hypothetical protein